MTSSTNTSYKNGAYQSTASTATSYGWYDAAVQSQVDYSPGTGGTYHTWYTNSATGVLQSASVNDGRPRSISLTNDALGQALRRDEADNNGSTGDPHEVWYRFNGKQIGYIGNNDTDNIGYAASLQRRVTASVAGPFKNGQTYGAGVVEFDQAYDAINSYQQGAGGGSYTVRDGDSLSGIAAQLWGDAGLWYKLAQANGLSGDAGLAAGQTLSVPAGVVRSSNTASTFRPYDVSQAYGDSSPTTPAPQAGKKNKCGAFGAILLVAIAVAVTLVLKVPVTNLLAFGTTAAPAGAVAGTAAAIGGAAIAGAAASVASQGFGVATGIQDTFDWKGVALAGLSAGITQGIGIDKIAGSATLGRAASGAIASALTQGIGVAVGLQSKFDWAGVAGAGIGAGVGQALGKPIGNLNLGKVSGALAANTAGGLVNAATRSLVSGTDFGDNLMAALPDIIGQTVGSWAAGEIQGGAGSSLHWHPDGDDQPVLAGADMSYYDGPITTLPQIDLDAAFSQLPMAGDIVVTASRRGRGGSVTGEGGWASSSGSGNKAGSLAKKIVTSEDATKSLAWPAGMQAEFNTWMKQHGRSASGTDAFAMAQGLSQRYLKGATPGSVGAWNDYMKAYRAGSASLTGSYEVPTTVVERVLGDVATNPAGTAVLNVADQIGFGIPSMLDGEGKIETLNRLNPNAAAVGQISGVAVSLLSGAGELKAGGAAAADSATPMMRGIAFENSGVAASQVEAFLPGQSVRRLSVRAFDDAGNLLPGRTVLDIAGNRIGGEGLGALEFKLHNGVSLTMRQAEHFPFLTKNGGIIVGNNGRSLGLLNLDRIGPLKVERINGATLPLTWWPK